MLPLFCTSWEECVCNVTTCTVLSSLSLLLPCRTALVSSWYVEMACQYFLEDVTSQICPPHHAKLCPASLFSQVYGWKWISLQWKDGFQQSWAEQMFCEVVGVNMLTLGKDRTGLQGVNRALLLQPSVFHQKFLER